MITVWLALGIAFAAGGLILTVSVGVRQADREDLAAGPPTWSAFLARRVLRLYARRDEPVQRPVGGEAL
jgi:hypothetical protein